MRTRVHLLAFMLMIGFVLAACGGSGADPEAAANESSASTQEGEGQTGTEASSSDATADPSGEPKTLDEYLGQGANFVRGGGGGPGGGGAGRANFDSDEAIEQQRLVQQEIQVCMQAQGFEYVPEEVGDGLRFFAASLQSGLSPAEYAETEGFGISTRFDALLEGDIDLTEASSPNDDHLATLSDGEADAWQFALRGAPPERNDEGQLIDPETGEPVQGRGATGGCSRQAQDAVRGDVADLSELALIFDEIEERIAADPRVAEIARSWADCMGGAGFDYQDESEARQAINDEFRPLIRSLFRGTQDASDGQGQGRGPGAGGGGNRLQAIAGLELTADQEQELQALQDRERALATASIECQGDTGEELAEIQATYEEAFVDENREALEALSR